MPSDTSNSNSNNMSIEELLEKFFRGSFRQQRRFIAEVESRANELIQLGPKLLERFDKESDDWTFGWILQVLNKHEKQFFSQLFDGEPYNFFLTPSSKGIDFSLLQKCLIEQSFEEADRMTSEILRTIAGPNALDRGYVYFSEAQAIEGVDLITLDRLWSAYSQGKFGFSIQGRLLDSLGGRYEKLWPRIGWKVDGVWTRYPNSFTWSIDAPEGHMPLVNQLRGVRLMDAYLEHPSLQSRRKQKR